MGVLRYRDLLAVLHPEVGGEARFGESHWVDGRVPDALEQGCSLEVAQLEKVIGGGLVALSLSLEIVEVVGVDVGDEAGAYAHEVVEGHQFGEHSPRLLAYPDKSLEARDVYLGFPGWLLGCWAVCFV